MAPMRPADILDASKIVLGIGRALSKKEVVNLLVATALGNNAPVRAALAEELLAREAKMTTGIGRGVAIPHTRAKEVERPVAALGVSREGVDFGAIDEEPVRIMFVFIMPETDPALHIKMLGEAVTLFGEQRVREAIIGAGSPQEVMEIIRRESPAASD